MLNQKYEFLLQLFFIRFASLIKTKDNMIINIAKNKDIKKPG